MSGLGLCARRTAPRTQVAKFASGALANLRAYDPNPAADPELEERLRLRRLHDVVEAMQSARAVDKVQDYARRWVARWRATRLLQARMRGVHVRNHQRQAHAERVSAATLLQAGYRGHVSRERLTEERERQALAAARLQARVRGSGVRAESQLAGGAGSAGSASSATAAGSASSATAAGSVTAGVAETSADAASADAGAAVRSRADGAWALVFGGESEEARAAVCAQLAERSGGTMLDVGVFVAIAQDGQESGQPGEASLLAEFRHLQQSGGLFTAVHLVAMMRVAATRYPPPYVLNGMPRMPSQLKNFEEAFGRLPVALELEGEPPTDAARAARNAMRKKADGQVCPLPAGMADAVVAGLAAFKAAGLPCATAGPEEGAASTTDGAAGASPPDAPPTALIIFGSECADLSAALLRRSGGTLINLVALAGVAEAYPGPESATFLEVQRDGGLVSPAVFMPVLRRALKVAAAPFVFSGFPRMPQHVKQLQSEFGSLGLAVAAGDISKAADSKLRQLVSDSGISVHESPSSSDEEVTRVLDAMARAGLQLQMLPPAPKEPLSEDAAASVLQARWCAKQEQAAGDGALHSLVGAMASEEGRKELRALFDTLDVDGDGEVTKREWGRALSKKKELLTKYFGGASMAELGKAFNRLDTDGSGGLSWEEFCSGAEVMGVVVSQQQQEEAVTAAVEEVLPASHRTDGQMVLVFGADCDAVSAAVAQRSGGSVFDMRSLLEFAEGETSEAAGELLATSSSGGVPSFKATVPVLRRALEVKAAPFVFSGFPRMASHVKQLQSEFGSLGLAVAAGDVSGGADAGLSKFMAKGGISVHESPSSSDEEVTRVLDAMARAGVAISSLPAPPSLQTVPATASEASASSEHQTRSTSSCVVLLGGTPKERATFGATLATRTGGTLLTTKALISSALSQANQRSEEILRLVQSGAVILDHTFIALIREQVASAPAPHILCDFPRVPTELASLEKSIGTIAVALSVHAARARSALEAKSPALALSDALKSRSHSLPADSEKALSTALDLIRSAGVPIGSVCAPDGGAAAPAGTGAKPRQKTLVLFTGAEDAAEQCAAQVARACGGSVISRKRLIAEAIRHESGDELRDLVIAHKVVTGSNPLLLAAVKTAVESKPPPYLMIGMCSGEDVHLLESTINGDLAMAFLIKLESSVAAPKLPPDCPLTTFESDALVTDPTLKTVPPKLSVPGLQKALDAMRAAGVPFSEEDAAASVLQARWCAKQEQAAGDGALHSLVGAMASEEGRKELRALFDTLDVDGDGEVTKREWGRALSKKKELLTKYFGGASMAELGKAFNRLDTDGSGGLSWEEFCSGAEVMGVVVSQQQQEEAVTAAVEEVLPASHRTDGQMVLVFGADCDAVSAAVAQRSGGSVFDMRSLLEFAEGETSEAAGELLATSSSGGVPSFKATVPVLRRALEVKAAPFVFSGFPRMASHVKQLQSEFGSLGLAVAAGDVSGGADAGLSKFMAKGGISVHESPSSSDEEVTRVLDAMTRAGVAWSTPAVVTKSPTSKAARGASRSPKRSAVPRPPSAAGAGGQHAGDSCESSSAQKSVGQGAPPRSPPRAPRPPPAAASNARPGSAARARPGSAARARPGSAARARPGSASLVRPGNTSHAPTRGTSTQSASRVHHPTSAADGIAARREQLDARASALREGQLGHSLDHPDGDQSPREVWGSNDLHTGPPPGHQPNAMRAGSPKARPPSVRRARPGSAPASGVRSDSAERQRSRSPPPTWTEEAGSPPGSPTGGMPQLLSQFYYGGEVHPIGSTIAPRFAGRYARDTRLQQIHSIYGQFLGPARVAPTRATAPPHVHGMGGPKRPGGFGAILVGDFFPMPSPPRPWRAAPSHPAHRRPPTHAAQSLLEEANRLAEQPLGYPNHSVDM